MLTSKPISTRPTETSSTEELQRQVATLQVKLNQAQKMATLGELLSTTTHEFNNVLMSVINYTRLAMRQQDEASRERSLKKVLDAGERAAKITSSILGAARNRSEEMAEIELSPLIEDTLVLIEREMRKYRISINREIEDVPATIGRGNEIQQVLLNLLINARQALPDGGEVLVRLTHDAENNINELTIRDNGCGIPAEKLKKIFDPFFTTKAGPDESGRGGTGLGLSACRDIIEAHHGRIRVASTKGKGTSFTLKLPAAVKHAKHT